MPTLAEMLTGRPQVAPASGPLVDSLKTKLSEAEFQRGIRATDWFSEFLKEYGEEPDLRPMSENPAKGPNYDYRGAWAAGIRPKRDPHNQNKYHWPSEFKSSTHPTAWKEQFMQKHKINPDALPRNVLDRMKGGF